MKPNAVLLAAIVIVLLSCSCHQRGPMASHEPGAAGSCLHRRPVVSNEVGTSFTCDSDYLKNEQIDFDFTCQGPLEFIELLRKQARDYKAGKHVFPFITLWCSRSNWITAEDIPALEALLDSTEPCANVKSAHSSWMEMQLSTVGNEAAYLIEGYHKNSYPPGLNSLRTQCK